MSNNGILELFSEKIWLLYLETTQMRAVSVNQNNELKKAETLCTAEGNCRAGSKCMWAHHNDKHLSHTSSYMIHCCEDTDGNCFTITYALSPRQGEIKLQSRIKL